MLPGFAEVVLAEGLEIVQQPLHERRGRRRDAALVASPILEALKEGRPRVGCGRFAAKLGTFPGAGEHHYGNRGGNRLRGYLGGLPEVCAAGGQVLGCV